VVLGKLGDWGRSATQEGLVFFPLIKISVHLIMTFDTREKYFIELFTKVSFAKFKILHFRILEKSFWVSLFLA